MDRRTTFIISLLYLVVILVLGLLFFWRRDLLPFIPDSFGTVPLGVPWFGALGAVLISLTGVFDHKRDWDNDLWPWHTSRPLIGIALSVVSVLILQAGILAVGSTPNTNSQPESSNAKPPSAGSTTPDSGSQPPKAGQPSPNPTPPPVSAGPQSAGSNQSGNANSTNGKIPPNLLYYLIAFLVGYREETFRELIKRLGDMILSPGGGGGGGGSPPSIQAVNPVQAAHDHPTQIVISGSGFTGTQSVKFGDAAAQKFTVDSDGQLTVTTPTVAAAGNVPLTVTTKKGSATHPFTFT